MRILILSDIGSIHTRRWVTSLCSRNHEIMLFGLLKSDENVYNDIPNLTIYSCNFTLKGLSRGKQWLAGKVQYLSAVSKLKKKIKEFKPDILHAHYASSYGLIGALVGFHPYIVSMWGSDVYEYPNSGTLYRKLLKYTFRKADVLLSTSNCMAQEAKKYTNKKISITPFGVDVNRFAPVQTSNEPKNQTSTFVVGNVKSLSPTYGIDILIKAFAELCRFMPEKQFLLKIAGIGPQKNELLALCKELEISDKVEFLGYLPNEQLPALYAQFDVAVSLSRAESFGVVAVEAMSCGCPVVTSDAPGFKEVVVDNLTGLIVPREDVHAAAIALSKLAADTELCRSMGEAGRKRIFELYNWEDNVTMMERVYDNCLANH